MQGGEIRKIEAPQRYIGADNILGRPIYEGHPKLNGALPTQTAFTLLK